MKKKFFGNVKGHVLAKYNSVSVRVRGSKEFLLCPSVKKQGEVESLLIFSQCSCKICKKDREAERQRGKEYRMIEEFLLLFADDVDLNSTKLVGLQNQVKNL